MVSLHLGYFFNGLFAHVIGKLDRFLHHFELPRQSYDAHRSVGCTDVGCLDFSLINLHAGGVDGCLAGSVREIVRSKFGETRWTWKLGDLDSPDRVSVLG